MEDALRERLLSDITPEQLTRMAVVCNRFPQLELSFQLDSSQTYHSGDEVQVHIQLTRQADPEDYSDFVTAHYFPVDKTEHWYVVVGANSTNHLLAIKKLSIKEQSSFSLTFCPESARESSQHFNIYLICDSYVGADQSHRFSLTVLPE